MNNEQKENYERLLKKRKSYYKKTTSEDAKNAHYKYVRLSLDEALKQLDTTKDPEKAFEGWSKARIKAYQKIDVNPNSYYYRFNKPGEKQRHGLWTKEESENFMRRLEEVGADGQWGIFSMAIPGRVGYQCSNYYRRLLMSKVLKDENYICDGKKLHYLFGRKDGQGGQIRTHRRKGSLLKKDEDMDNDSELNSVTQSGMSVSNTTIDEGKETTGRKKKRSTTNSTPNSTTSSTQNAATATLKRKRRSRKVKRSQDFNSSGDDFDFYSDDNDDSGNYSISSWNTTKRTRSRRNNTDNSMTDSTLQTNENPLPGFTDPITLEEVIKPAISPYGHVMGYDSWVRCLNRPDCRNICPITKKPLSKRELVILTFENIEQYRDKIINK